MFIRVHKRALYIVGRKCLAVLRGRPPVGGVSCPFPSALSIVSGQRRGEASNRKRRRRVRRGRRGSQDSQSVRRRSFDGSKTSVFSLKRCIVDCSRKRTTKHCVRHRIIRFRLKTSRCRSSSVEIDGTRSKTSHCQSFLVEDNDVSSETVVVGLFWSKNVALSKTSLCRSFSVENNWTQSKR